MSFVSGQKTTKSKASEHLYKTAEAQQGYFTAKQAKAAGFDERFWSR